MAEQSEYFQLIDLSGRDSYLYGFMVAAYQFFIGRRQIGQEGNGNSQEDVTRQGFAIQLSYCVLSHCGVFRSRPIITTKPTTTATY